MTPVTLITGFLGSGKTTLASNLLQQDHGLRIAMLVNDFGSLNIDATLLGAVHDDIVALENGCICCSLAGGFHAAIAKVLRRDPLPDCILVECSGASDPIEVATILRDPDLAAHAPLDGVLAVVDAAGWPALDGEAAWLARRQVLAADLVLINKQDLCSDAALAALEEELGALAPDARFARTTQARIPLDACLGLAGADTARDRARDGAGGSAPAFVTVTLTEAEPIAAAALNAFLKALPMGVLRAKGMVELAERPDTRFLVQATGKAATLAPWAGHGAAGTGSALVLIGKADGLDQAAAQWHALAPAA
jgi:G3E family GTPase